MTIHADRLAELERLARAADIAASIAAWLAAETDHVSPRSHVHTGVTIADVKAEILRLGAEIARMRPVYAAAVDLDNNWDLRLIAEGEDWYSDFARLEDAAKAATGRPANVDAAEMDERQEARRG